MATGPQDATADAPSSTATKPELKPASGKLHGRAFYESIGKPKYIVAPMVDQSEFAWRMLTRSFIPAEEQSSLLAYTPMFHARLFAQDEKYRAAHFQSTRPAASSSSDPGEPWLDGNPAIDRPLFVQFCANDPEHLLEAARKVAPHCDAVDLNLGCPQGIARKGRYGAFLQEDQDLIFRLINTLHRELPIPVTAKIRILETEEKTLAYAQNVLKAGASILTVHGRRREQKGHLTGTADWKMLRFLRDNLPPDTVMFANGNVLQGADVERCLEATGADGVMSAEGNLSDPTIFGIPPPVGEEGREYWRGRDGKGGFRVDAVTRRYLDLLHKYAFEEPSTPPQRRPLFVPGDDTAWLSAEPGAGDEGDADGPPRKKRKPTKRLETSPNLSAVQPHLFHLLRHFVSKHTDVRDLLARSPREGMDGYERVLAAVERRVAEGLIEYERTGGQSYEDEVRELYERDDGPEGESSVPTLKRCKRPWWVVQPIIRPLPSEAMAKGAIRPSKKDLKAGEDGKKQAQEGAKESNGSKADDAGKSEASVPPPSTAALESTEQAKEIASRDELVSG